MHEVLHFSHLIADTCKRNDIEHIVDVGAGLVALVSISFTLIVGFVLVALSSVLHGSTLQGHLDRQLCQEHHLNVLGLEQDSYRVAEANERSQQSLNGDHHQDRDEHEQRRPIFKKLTLDGQQPEQMNNVIDTWLTEIVDSGAPAAPGHRSMCMVGLHACGDLSADMLRLFVCNERFETLLLVSCCYHRMTSKDHFPMSHVVGQLEVDCGDERLLVPGAHLTHLLRLGAQDSNYRCLNDSSYRNQQLYHTFYRAVLEYYSVHSTFVCFIFINHHLSQVLLSINNYQSYKLSSICCDLRVIGD